MANIVKKYQVKFTKKLASGEIKTYVANKTYKVKKLTPEFTVELQNEIHAKLGMNVPKKIICEQHQISLYYINRLLTKVF